MLYYTAEKLSAKQSYTPEGYLLCEEVPIARVGQLIYTARELGDTITPGIDGIIRIERNADVLFSPETIGSFNGKSITNDHPPDMLKVQTVKQYHCGPLLNVRRGYGSLDTALVADFLVTDPDAIRDIRAGKREVSCGYDADYEEIMQGYGRQTRIVGNHVALVPAGRCGPSCSIGDKQPMANSFKDTLMKMIGAKDDVEAQRILSEGIGTPTTDAKASGGVTVIVNDRKTVDADKGDDKGDDSADWKKSFDAMSSRMDGMESGLKEIKDAIGKITKDAKSDDDDDDDDGETKDAKEEGDDEEDEEEAGDTSDKKTRDKKTKDRKTKDRKTVDARSKSTKDSSSLAERWQDTSARAAFLFPGAALPTFDAKASFDTSRETLCEFRRGILVRAQATTDTAAMLKPFMGTVPVMRMTCDAVRSVFNSVTEVARQRNNALSRAGLKGSALGFATTDGPTRDPIKHPRTLEEIAAAQKSFWDRQPRLP